MSNTIVFLYGWGPEEEGRLSTLLYIVETTLVMDMGAVVFFFTDGAVIARKGTALKISEDIERRFKSILDNERAQILVCEEAVRKRGFMEDIEEGVKIVGYATFLDLALSADKVITI